MCKETYGRSFDPDQEFCTLHDSRTKSSARGDSGSGLLCKDGSEWLVGGLVSFGMEEPYSTQYPSVNARVGYFNKWITENMQAKPTEGVRPDRDRNPSDFWNWWFNWCRRLFN
ncbi:protease [Cichlidogyrus casuarinus]|uniref:Protease n=1 Tax=Cichlidogyrus casuarinus TaxID=1844966 RepID=A0ABD2PQV0_9PLAT